MWGRGGGSGGPERIGGAGVVISPHIDRFFRSDGKAVAASRWGDGLGQVTHAFRTHATINEAQSVSRAVDDIVLRISRERGRACRSSCGRIRLNSAARGQGIRITVHLVRANGRSISRNREVRCAGEGTSQSESRCQVLLAVVVE